MAVRDTMTSGRARAALAAVLLLASSLPVAVLAQQAAINFPDGPGKSTVVNLCGSCHDIGRLAAGYTPEGWHTVIRMTQNFGAPIPPADATEITDYLIKSFPERPRPAAAAGRSPTAATSSATWTSTATATR